MIITGERGGRRITIEQGEYYATNDKETLSTLLGSCVACCLWDPVSRTIGMNHFLLASRRHRGSLPIVVSEAGRYGTQAMELLIDHMLKLGASRQRLRAKAFGGGNVLQASLGDNPMHAVGEINARFVREYLTSQGIPLIASHLGGAHGRVIHFDGEDFSVYMKRIGTASYESVAAAERCYFAQQLQAIAAKPADSKKPAAGGDNRVRTC